VGIQLPPGSNALRTVEQNGNLNPPQLHIGASGLPLTSSGWMIERDTIPVSFHITGQTNNRLTQHIFYVYILHV
jgi:hypothetical protein